MSAMLTYSLDNNFPEEKRMADRIQDFPAEERPPTRRYPWKEWADGSVWRLVRGEDFDQLTDQFRNRFFSKAKQLGLKVRTTKMIEDNGVPSGREILVVQFFQLDGSPLSRA
jgi:hypothetical protein